MFKLDAPWDAGHEFGARTPRGGFAGRAAAERVRGRPVHLPPLQDVPGVEVRVEIAGVPEGAMLTAGRILPSGAWTLDRDELSGLRLLPVGGSGALRTLAPVSLQVSYFATNLATGESGVMVTTVYVAGSDGAERASAASRVRTGAVLGTVAVPFDADESEVVRFRLVDDAGGRFAIDTWAGTVTIADGALFAGDAGSRHVITVEVASVDGWMTTQQFAVTGDSKGAFTVTAVAEEDPDAAAPWAPATLYLPRRAA